MHVTQTLSQGLKQEYKVVLPAGDLAAKLQEQLAEAQAKAQIKGFRPGKAPISYLRKVYGKGMMRDVLQEAINEAQRKIVEDNNLRVAVEPKFDFPAQEEVEKALEAEGDFAFAVTFETLPSIEIGSFDDISIERVAAPVGVEDVAKQLDALADRVREFEDRPEGEAAAAGDKLTLDFSGKIDGEVFEGGEGSDVDVVLGSNLFIPGFEDQLVGAVKGQERQVNVRFPETYSVKTLAGKDAVFDVTVKNVAAPKTLEIDDEFAKKYGFENLAEMQDAVRANIEADFAKASRAKLKRALLDALDAKYKFDLPETLVENEFSAIWKDVEEERKREGDGGKSEEEARVEFRAIAARRVRLGLVLAEIGQAAGVVIEDKDVTQALVERVRMFPGQEKQVWDYYRNNEQALAQLRAPLFEERVVDHIAARIKIADKTVTREELFAEEEE